MAQKPRALIIDDSPGIRRGLAKFLETNGWEPIAARDAIDARPYLDSAARIVPEVIIIDLVLESELGSLIIGLVRLINRVAPMTGRPTRIIGYTALPEDDPEVLAAIKSGVDAIVFKPGDLDQLLRVMTGEHPGDVAIEPNRSPT